MKSLKLVYAGGESVLLEPVVKPINGEETSDEERLRAHRDFASLAYQMFPSYVLETHLKKLCAALGLDLQIVRNAHWDVCKEALRPLPIGSPKYKMWKLKARILDLQDNSVSGLGLSQLEARVRDLEDTSGFKPKGV